MSDERMELVIRRLELANRIRRRQFLRLMAAAGLGAVSLSALAACRQGRGDASAGWGGHAEPGGGRTRA